MTGRGVIRIIVPAIIFFAGMLTGFMLSSGSATDISRGATVGLMIDAGLGEVRTFTDIVPLEDETLFSLTRRVAQEEDIPFAYKDYAGLGAFITQIGPMQESANGAFWQFWVNNVYAQVGADAYVVQPGDVVVWKFTASKQ
jgi:hypothetical protein